MEDDLLAPDPDNPDAADAGPLDGPPDAPEPPPFDDPAPPVAFEDPPDLSDAGLLPTADDGLPPALPTEPFDLAPGEQPPLPDGVTAVDLDPTHNPVSMPLDPITLPENPDGADDQSVVGDTGPADGHSDMVGPDGELLLGDTTDAPPPPELDGNAADAPPQPDLGVGPGLSDPPVAPDGAITLPGTDGQPPLVVDPNAPQDQSPIGGPIDGGIELPSDGTTDGVQPGDYVPDIQVHLPPLEGTGDQGGVMGNQPGAPDFPGTDTAPTGDHGGVMGNQPGAPDFTGTDSTPGHIPPELQGDGNVGDPPPTGDDTPSIVPEAPSVFTLGAGAIDPLATLNTGVQDDLVASIDHAMGTDGHLSLDELRTAAGDAHVSIVPMDAAAATAAGLGTDVAPTIVTHIEGEGTLLLRVVPVSDTVVELHAQTGAVYTAETSELERQWHASTQPAIVVTPEPVSVPAAVDPAAVAAPVTPAAAHTNGGSDLGTKLAMGGAVLLPIAGLGAYLATRKRQ